MFMYLEDVPKLRCSQCGQINNFPIRYWQDNNEITECKYCDYKKITATITTAGTGESIIYKGNNESIQAF